MVDSLRARLGVCTDEVSASLEEALDSATAWGLREVEIQEFWGRSPIDVTEADLARARDCLDARGLTVSAIGSQFLKLVMLGHVPLGGVGRDPAFLADLAMLRAQIRAARVLGAPIVRAYAFRRDEMIGLGNPSPRLSRGGPLPDAILEKIVEGLRISATIAADAGIVLGLENVRSCWANTGYNTGTILRAVDHPALQATWDPGNCYVSGGDPYPEGYEAVRGRICHVHIKDACVTDPATGLIEWRAVGQGEVDWAAQCAALRRAGYAGGLSLETHWHPPGPTGSPNKIEDSRVSLTGIERVMAASMGIGEL